MYGPNLMLSKCATQNYFPSSRSESLSSEKIYQRRLLDKFYVSYLLGMSLNQPRRSPCASGTYRVGLEDGICFRSENYETYGVSLLALAPKDRPHLKRVNIQTLAIMPGFLLLFEHAFVKSGYMKKIARGRPLSQFFLKIIRKIGFSRRGLQTFAIMSGFINE